MTALTGRARWVRRWLRDRAEREIVVVAHGDILRYITDGTNSGEPWRNAEVKVYTFLNDENDAEAVMIPFVATGVVSESKPTNSRLWLRHIGRTESVY